MANIAKNGAAIIGNELVPPSETLVIKTLATLKYPATVPQIALAMGDTFSDASLYTLLRRLHEKRNLVLREEVIVQVQGRSARRVMWSPSPVAIKYFSFQSDVDSTELRGAEVPG